LQSFGENKTDYDENLEFISTDGFSYPMQSTLILRSLSAMQAQNSNVKNVTSLALEVLQMARH